jgi:hypothetical protein
VHPSTLDFQGFPPPQGLTQDYFADQRWWNKTPKTPGHNNKALLAALLCLTVAGSYWFAAESESDQFPFLATASVVTQDSGAIAYDGAPSMAARNPDDCIEKLDAMALRMADHYQQQAMAVRLACVEKDTGRVMLYVTRKPKQFHACDSSGQACPATVLAAH